MEITEACLYLVWLMLHDPSFFRKFGRMVEPDDLPEGALRALTALGIEHVGKYSEPVTSQILELKLQDGWRPERYKADADRIREVYPMLAEQYVVVESESPAVYDAVLEWLKKRKVGRALDEAAGLLQRGDGEAAAEAMAGVQTIDDEDPELDITGNLADMLAEKDDAAVPTGIEFIDRAWKGGIRLHELGVVLATTNAGKSQCLCFMAAAAYRAGRRVLVYTFELTPRQVLRRTVAALLKKSLEGASLTETQELLKTIRVQRGLEGYLRIRTGDKSVRDLRADIDALDRDGEKPDIILLDSADDLRPAQKREQEWLTLSDIYSELRRVAVDKGVAIWTSAQTDRTAVDKARISLKNVGRSFAKAQRAHFVVALTQTEQQQLDPFGPFMSIYILKDSEHSSPGQWQEVRVTFGPGGKDFAGFESKE